MTRQWSNWLSLLVGTALLIVSAGWLWEVDKQGRSWWGGRKLATDAASVSDQDAATADASTDDASAESQSQSIDRISAGTVAKPGHFLHKKIAIDSYKTIEFDLPGQMRNAELEGSYLCVTRKGVRDESGAAVELSLMNEAEYAKFNADRGMNSSSWQRPASHADIDWDLKDTYGNTQKYYLVFRNASRRPGVAIVDADFAVKNSE
jgi:hypothetical protein